MPPSATQPDQDNILLTPYATLRFAQDEATAWQQQLFALGANRTARNLPAAAAFWARLAQACIRELCHAANPDEPSAAEAEALPGLPLPEGAADWLDAAPPMLGGEYLSLESLAGVWAGLLAWCADKVRLCQGLAPFLEALAPQWHQVGRVFFHLAENKLNPDRPFAFLATYTTGFTPTGRLRHTQLSQAVKHYGSERNFAALRHLLQPVQKAAETLPWVQSMLESRALFAPRTWLPGQAHTFLTSVEALEEAGIGVRLPNWWKKRSRPMVRATMSSPGVASSVGLDSLVDFDVTVCLGDEPLSEEDVRELLEGNHQGLTLFKGNWIEVDADRLREVLDHWEHVREQARAGNIGYMEGLRLLSGLPQARARDEDEEFEETLREWSFLEAGEGFRELLHSARTASSVQQEDIPALHATLRPYQIQGVSWMRFLGRLGMGACLADDMGLGKTIQVLALLLLEQAEEHHEPPTLLIIPASLLANWKAEAARFAPSLRLGILHPSEGPLPKTFSPALVSGRDLVITTYSQCSRLSWLGQVQWRRIILDEAQAIKNPQTKQSTVVRKLPAARRIALTGTPIENRLSDLWSLFDFLNPGLLGTSRSFADLTTRLQTREGGLAPLRRLTAPYILRRLKTDKGISESLPDKIETSLYCHLSKQQAVLYQQVTDQLEAQMQAMSNDEESEGSSSGRGLKVIQAIMLLKQVCNHPVQAGLVDESGMDYDPRASGKFQCVGELCADIASRQERVLVFTQFKEIIDPLAGYLASIFGRPGLVLHGSVAVKKRGALVEEFQREDGPPFFILSLKAGGTGLNLTRASHVIHFDRWWNPAVEDQATDRAFRIGQKNNVLVHKCITRGTIEEKIDEMIRDKRQLASDVLGNMENTITALSDKEILDLVRLDLGRALEG